MVLGFLNTLYIGFLSFQILGLIYEASKDACMAKHGFKPVHSQLYFEFADFFFYTCWARIKQNFQNKAVEELV